MLIQLIAKNGRLYFPQGGLDDNGNEVADQPSLLLVRYAAGDCDTVPWPLVPAPYNGTTVEGLVQRLACALYDERECNPFFTPNAKILLPDGELFNIDLNLE